MTYPGMTWQLGAARAAGEAERKARTFEERQKYIFARANASLRAVELENKIKRRCRVRIVTVKETAHAS